MSSGIACAERARLLHLYSEATAKLSHEVEALASTAGEVSGHSFDRAWERCEELRALCAQIQEQIYEHLREHRCALDINSRGPGRR
jgi:hypothetical protein